MSFFQYTGNPPRSFCLILLNQGMDCHALMDQCRLLILMIHLGTALCKYFSLCTVWESNHFCSDFDDSFFPAIDSSSLSRDGGSTALVNLPVATRADPIDFHEVSLWAMHFLLVSFGFLSD